MAKKRPTDENGKIIWPGIKPTQARLSDRDKATIAAIREWHGLPSASSAIRHALQIALLQVPEKIQKKHLKGT